MNKKNMLVGAGLICFLYIMGNIASILIYSTKDEKRAADVAIVLGAATDEDAVLPVYRERLNHSIFLYQQGYVKKIIVTGGLGEGHKQTDASLARQYLINRGIPKEDVFTEEKSTITQENLQNSKMLMEEAGYHTAIIVSDPLHMKRAMRLAKELGMQAYSSPTSTTMYRSLKTKLPFLARETFYYIGCKWYRNVRLIAFDK